MLNLDPYKDESSRTGVGIAGDWQDDGPCVAAKANQLIKPHYESKSVPLQVPVKTPAPAGRKTSRSFKL